MVIIVKLDRMLLERNMSLTDLADKVGVTIANLSILKTGKAKAVRFSTLNLICKTLDCQPGDIIFYEDVPEAITASISDAIPGTSTGNKPDTASKNGE